MRTRLDRIAIVIVGLVLTLFAMTADATRGDLDARWADYRNVQSALEPAYTFPHSTCFKAAALAYGLPETLLLAVARGESDFEPTARSRANAHGVMQILWPGTARHLGIHRLSELYDPCTNIDAGARYLEELLRIYDGNVHLALAAYNYGPGRISKDGARIPSGAEWYSGYIYRHLNYVLGNGKGGTPIPDTLYSDIGQSTLLTFGEPYRAEAFIDRLEEKAPGLTLDWFRRGTGEFEVVMTYASREEFDTSARKLRNAGFRID
ncbi:MAG: lytic transglycosylase domain-containing protein [Gammaproteobacteria bacterium]|nr:lytic transglycosylase domain-containing protein [Gammaproteobacteria bacterium]NNF48712.1 lytic transglycosylase domain-containing protein [Woeseiaceae bacterium]MBT8093675.1 lytic transglycosylase domain-containing protein [Gammaproteobacteria bacterium]MBT8104019.1 lytic transglycosylase domain-containing protein [Gammaproteobacteria bacterium]NNK24034.1 lytic transglycosylase domain-containing protein [Woeseiaceae bacterium]